ncbi:histidinol-phosphatase HisJ [Bacillus dakarensis]|uniref:histidinol-phosphatase HisJ n=1 Tax=Robertmurraya dakarensis TaxID=1926278 RepID=UPI00098134EE|nr:histidinol-phosphatase HisJ [Bacillus dakarensis]
MLKDGHIHTPYCPHGTNDSLEQYVETAIRLGFSEISFTEHAPLPEGFIDTTPQQDSAMDIKDLPRYFEEIDQLKSKYKDKIKINTGLEVDYIEGFEEQTTSFLNQYGERLDDAVLSVHFLKSENSYDCLDYSPEYFGNMIQHYGSVEKIYEQYYRTLLKSINADLGPYKPKRIGHITLVKKFQKKFPAAYEFKDELMQILYCIKVNGYELDYNGAGTAKPLCREPYPPLWIAEEASKLDIPLVYGSDAHQLKDLKQGFHEMFKQQIF